MKYIFIIVAFLIMLIITDRKYRKFADHMSDKTYEVFSETKKDIANIYESLMTFDQEILDTIEVIMEPIDPISFYKLPEKGSSYAAGYDVYWSTVNKELNRDGSVTIDPGETLKFGTNLKVMITIDNFYLDICSRSGMAINKNLVVVNSPARIDSDYRGELLIGLKNISDNPITIEPQSRVAQCTLHREVPTSFLLGDVIDNTDRGDGGLGHSGETEIVNN